MFRCWSSTAFWFGHFGSSGGPRVPTMPSKAMRVAMMLPDQQPTFQLWLQDELCTNEYVRWLPSSPSNIYTTALVNRWHIEISECWATKNRRVQQTVTICLTILNAKPDFYPIHIPIPIPNGDGLLVSNSMFLNPKYVGTSLREPPRCRDLDDISTVVVVRMKECVNDLYAFASRPGFII